MGVALEAPAAMLERLAGRCRFPPGPAVSCAVSGGPDSLALLVLARHVGLAVMAIHVDHGLRPGSEAEADVVARAAHRFGATFEARRVVVPEGSNVEARARTARYGVLPDDVLTGHTADDQAETVLLHLLRGGGLGALAGMAARRRPLLALRRRETAELCDALSLVPVSDPTNHDLRFRRNRVRHEVLPLLADIAERDVVPLLARAAELTRADVDLLDELAAAYDVTDAAALAVAPLPLARRAVRAWLRQEHPPDSATVDRVLRVAAGEARATDVGGGRRVERSGGRLRLVRPSGPGLVDPAD